MNFKLRKLYLLVILCIILQVTAYGQFPKEGNWQGNIHFSQATVPFTFQVSYPEGTPVITLINWEEKLVIDEVEVEGNSIFMPMHVFDAFISAKFSSGKMKGYWVKLDSIPFTANYNASRFKTRKKRNPVHVENRINMTFLPPGSLEYPGIGLFSQQGNIVTATVLTEVGDYRYFEGVMEKNVLKVSAFDGVHAFMLTGKYEEGKWMGEFHFDNKYVEKWTGFYDESAELQDPFEMVILDKDTEKPYFDILAPASGRNLIDPTKYDGKVLVIQIFGTWCPNSFDQTKFLMPWFEQNQRRGVEMLAVSYEVNYSKEYGLRRIEEYKSKMGIDYEVFLGGRVNKEQAAMAFPFINKLQAFPTLVILDKNGYARYVNSYFTGPATGEYYIKFQERFNGIINQLLEE